jgi:hypothetical protein
MSAIRRKKSSFMLFVGAEKISLRRKVTEKNSNTTLFHWMYVKLKFGKKRRLNSRTVIFEETFLKTMQSNEIRYGFHSYTK